MAAPRPMARAACVRSPFEAPFFGPGREVCLSGYDELMRRSMDSDKSGRGRRTASAFRTGPTIASLILEMTSIAPEPDGLLEESPCGPHPPTAATLNRGGVGSNSNPNKQNIKTTLAGELKNTKHAEVDPHYLGGGGGGVFGQRILNLISPNRSAVAR